MTETRNVFAVLVDGDHLAGVNLNASAGAKGCNYVPATLSYELPKPEPRFKKGDVVARRAPDVTRTIDVVDKQKRLYIFVDGTRSPYGYIETYYELVPVPSFVVGEMVLDTVTRQYAQVRHFSVPFVQARVQLGSGEVCTRHAHELEKLA